MSGSDRMEGNMFKPIEFPGSRNSGRTSHDSIPSSPASSPPRTSPATSLAFPPSSLSLPPTSLPHGVFLPPNFNLQRPPSDYLNLQLAEGKGLFCI